jgi:hypothetical protein
LKEEEANEGNAALQARTMATAGRRYGSRCRAGPRRRHQGERTQARQD